MEGGWLDYCRINEKSDLPISVLLEMTHDLGCLELMWVLYFPWGFIHMTSIDGDWWQENPPCDGFHTMVNVPSRLTIGEDKKNKDKKNTSTASWLCLFRETKCSLPSSCAWLKAVWLEGNRFCKKGMLMILND